MIGLKDWQKPLAEKMVEGNLGVNGTIVATAHKPGGVVLSVDPHGGDENYEPEEVSDE